MSLKNYLTTLLGRLNQPNANTLATLLQFLGFGSMLRALVSYLRGYPVDTVINPYVFPTGVNSITLPESAKCRKIEAVYARAGAGTLGPLVIDHDHNGALADTAPAAGHCAVSASGDLLFAAADAWTKLDIDWSPEKYDVAEYEFPVVPGGVLTLPASITNQGVLFMLEAEALAGVVTGKCIVEPPAAGSPAATREAQLNLAKTTVQFYIGDAVTKARVKLALVCAIDVNAELEGTSETV
jgi:hypothetical protein